MKIAHIVSTFPPYQGGMGNVAAALQHELAAQGHVCDVFTPAYGPCAPQEHVNRLRPWLAYGNAAFLPQIGRGLGGYDIIHLHYPFFGAAEAVAWQASHLQRPLILTYHMDTVGTGWKAMLFKAYHKLVFPWIVRLADAITVSTLDYAKHSALEPFLTKKRVEEIPFGVANDFAPIERGGQNQLDVLRLLFVGALDRAHYFKGLPNLLQAAAEARKKGVPLRLTIVGDGDMRFTYQETARALGLADVTFAGRLDRAALVRAYQQADVAVLPSIDRSEAFGLVVVESMACGTPVVASDLPGVRTVLEPGRTGWLCRPGDVSGLAAVLAGIWQDRARLPAMRQAAAERVNQLYRWPSLVKKLVALYEDALSSKLSQP